MHELLIIMTVLVSFCALFCYMINIELIEKYNVDFWGLLKYNDNKQRVIVEYYSVFLSKDDKIKTINSCLGFILCVSILFFLGMGKLMTGGIKGYKL